MKHPIISTPSSVSGKSLHCPPANHRAGRGCTVAFLLLGTLANWCALSQPANDMFDARISLVGPSVSVSGTTDDATLEAGETNRIAGSACGASVWWTWTAPTNGAVRVDTFGSAFDTVVGIYTNDRLQTLRPVASNNNASGRNDGSSLATFNAVQGTEYQIVVAAAVFFIYMFTGPLQLELDMVPSIALTAPSNYSVALTGTPISLQAEASTPNPPIVRVDFYRGATRVGSDSTPPFAVADTNAPRALNRYSAVVTDNAGQVATSAVMNVTVQDLGITITGPAEGSTYLSTNPILVNATPYLPGGAITNVEFLMDSLPFASDSVRPFSGTWSNVIPGLHVISALGRDTNGNLYPAFPVLIAVAQPFVPAGSAWKYFDLGTDLRTNWWGLHFDDADWTNGPAELGYGDEADGRPEATVVGFGPDPNNRFITTYFRHAFVATNLSSYSNIVVRVLRDDGAVVYLNGSELARYNMGAGPISFNTLAPFPATDDGTVFYPTEVPISRLLEGTNVLAVEVHQNTNNSTDLSFDLELMGMPLIPRNQAPTVGLFSPTNGESFLAPAQVLLRATASDPDGQVRRVEFFAGDTKLGETTHSPFAWLWTNLATGIYRARAVATDDQGGRSSSDSIRFGVLSAAGTPFVILHEPLAGTVYEWPARMTLVAEALGANPITNLVLLAGNTVLGASATDAISLTWSNVPPGTHVLTALAMDAQGRLGTSAPVAVTVPVPSANTLPPTVLSAWPPAGALVSNLTSVRVVFSEPVTGVDANDLRINGMAATAMTGSGSNYSFSFPQPAYGSVTIRWASDHGIMDIGYPSSLGFDENGVGASWSYEFRDATGPALVAKDPGAGTIVSNLTQLTATFSEAVIGVSAGDLLINDRPAASVAGSGTTYHFQFAQPASGLVTFTWATNHGITDLSPAANPFRPTGTSARWSSTLDARTSLIQACSIWRLFKGWSEASWPTDAWRQIAFDDSRWSNAVAPFFYGDPYTNALHPGTYVGDMQSNYTSIYLRQSFVIPNAAAVTNLFLRAQSDDGFIAWINGVEVFRYNMPTGEVGFGGVALTNVIEPQFRGAVFLNHTLPNPRGYLRDGTNMLAVHAFNQNLTNSSDFGFDAQLYTFLSDAGISAPGLQAIEPSDYYQYALSNIVVVFTEPVDGVDAADLLINGMSASGLSVSNPTTYSFRFAQPAYGVVSIEWATNHGIADLDLVPKPFNGTLPGEVWQYRLLHPSAPRLASQLPPPDAVIGRLTNITVTFNEPVTGVHPADLRINGAPALSVSGDGQTYNFRVIQPPYGPVSINWATNHGITDLEVIPHAFDSAGPGATWTYWLLDQTAPTIATATPAPGSTVVNLTHITVSFTEPVLSVDARDLRINGVPARSVHGDGITYTFWFSQPNSNAIDVSWSPYHGICDSAPMANAFDHNGPGARWSYQTVDTVAPIAVEVLPPPLASVRSLRRISIRFDELVTGVEGGDLLINGLPTQLVSGSGAGPYLFSFDEPPTGHVAITWATGHAIRDLNTPPNSFRSAGWSYELSPGLPGAFAVKHVIHLSIDALGAAYLESYVSNAPGLFQNFKRLQEQGACTYRARTDYDISVTLPNHACMFTARPVLAPWGWSNNTHHGLVIDSDGPDRTIHNTGNPAVPYKSSVFDVAHDRGYSTAFLYSKQSLTIFTRSWDQEHGAPDSIGADNGSNKLDFVLYSGGGSSYGTSPPLVDELVARIETNALWNYTFLHFTETDTNGHAIGWGTMSWFDTATKMDAQVGRLLDALEANPALRARTILLVTADHGGGGDGGGAVLTSHSDASSYVNYSIPLFLFGPGIPGGVDLYSLFSNRFDPGPGRGDYTASAQPLRTGDSGNLLLSLLGMPPVPGSCILPVMGPHPVPLRVARQGALLVVSWPVSPQPFFLEAAPVLGPATNWQPITDGIVTNGAMRVYGFVPNAANPIRFFRLRSE